MIRCPICEKEFEPSAPAGGGRTSGFCSTTCRKENHRRRARTIATAKRDAVRTGARPEAPVEATPLPPVQRYSARDAAVLEANRLAAMLSDAPADGADPLSPPAFIADPHLAPAAQVWRDLAPDLARLG